MRERHLVDMHSQTHKHRRVCADSTDTCVLSRVYLRVSQFHTLLLGQLLGVELAHGGLWRKGRARQDSGPCCCCCCAEGLATEAGHGGRAGVCLPASIGMCTRGQLQRYVQSRAQGGLPEHTTPAAHFSSLTSLARLFKGGEMVASAAFSKP